MDEALLRTLFDTCRATGLCMYDRHRMPLAVLDGALATHPVAVSRHQPMENPYYDERVVGLTAVDDAEVLAKLGVRNRA